MSDPTPDQQWREGDEPGTVAVDVNAAILLSGFRSCLIGEEDSERVGVAVMLSGRRNNSDEGHSAVYVLDMETLPPLVAHLVRLAASAGGDHSERFARGLIANLEKTADAS